MTLKEEENDSVRNEDDRVDDYRIENPSLSLISKQLVIQRIQKTIRKERKRGWSLSQLSYYNKSLSDLNFLFKTNLNQTLKNSKITDIISKIEENLKKEPKDPDFVTTYKFYVDQIQDNNTNEMKDN